MIAAESILFGYGANAPVQAVLGRKAGITQASMSRYRKNPDLIKFRDLKALVKARDLDDKEILMLFGRERR